MDYFDAVILSYVDHIPLLQATIMGRMLGKWRGCDVAFISERIEFLIENKQIVVCEDKVDQDDCYWSRTLTLV